MEELKYDTVESPSHMLDLSFMLFLGFDNKQVLALPY
jgi:hypothetical protein